MANSNSSIKRLFIIISLLIPMIVVVLIFLPKGASTDIKPWILTLPFYNAIINSMTALLLLLGLYFVKSGNVSGHKLSMVSAFLLGCLFLIFYVLYHSNAQSVKFGGEGIIRYVYFTLLISHILMAFIVVPLVLSAVYFAVSQKIENHKKIVKYTFPVWLYVSISGVIVYLMISPYYPY